MKTKQCSKCKEAKPVEGFSKSKASKDGLQSSCKACQKQYHEANKKAISERRKRYYEANKEAHAEYQKKHREANKEAVAEYHKQYQEANKEAIAERSKKYYQANKEAIAENHKKYQKRRRAEDLVYRMVENLRRRMHKALKGKCKADSTKALLGCTYKEARAHIEAQFTEGMSWDKMGRHGIHIDHIRPCASFDLSDPEQQRECFHYTNIQPLWAEDNLKKSDKW